MWQKTDKVSPISHAFQFRGAQSEGMICNFSQEIQQFQAAAEGYLSIAFHTQCPLHGCVLAGINPDRYRGQQAWSE